MKIEIKNRWGGCVLFSGEYESAKMCVEAAVRSGANLSGANLSRADLFGANLSRADLSGADLSGANLSRADLSGANLSRADLSRANLSGANLSGANLSRANLSGANLSGANLSRADLFGADLSRANLSGANLSGANLSRADLFGADLFGANLKDVKGKDLIIARSQICPTEGAFVGWKKLKNDVIAKLVIPFDAERINAIGSRKCRASKAFVHEIFDEVKEHFDSHTGKLKYIEGHEVVPDEFDDSVQVECSHGIHFFITRIEAENY